MSSTETQASKLPEVTIEAPGPRVIYKVETFTDMERIITRRRLVNIAGPDQFFSQSAQNFMWDGQPMNRPFTFEIEASSIEEAFDRWPTAFEKGHAAAAAATESDRLAINRQRMAAGQSMIRVGTGGGN